MPGRTSLPAPASRAVDAFQTFFRLESAGGILLLISAVVAIVWANSPFAASYFALWQTPVTVGFGDYALTKGLILWINDGLMALFFLLVGSEIKREMAGGELAGLRQAALPVMAAIGGMVFPALLYVAFNVGGAIEGWGIPMATDIAFALGVLALIGSRVPLALKIFLTALAIIDDLGAILVIAFFYTSDLSLTALAVAGVLFAVLLLINRLGVRALSIYLLIGAGLWLAVLKSGVHATIAGVLLALSLPTTLHAASGKPNRSSPGLLRKLSNWFRGLGRSDSPLHAVEHGLHKWVAFGIMPIFALANAGVALGGNLGAMLVDPITLGIATGLIFGKQIGVTGLAWLSVRLRWAELPAGVTWAHVYGVSWLCAIGFTMSLFIAGLAFSSPADLDASKVGILGASTLSGIVGYIVLRAASKRASPTSPLGPPP